MKRPRIAIFFASGSVIDERGRRGDQVTSEKEIEAWMNSMSEMDIIAETAGFFIAPGIKPNTMADWSKIAQSINSVYRRFDGFVVIHDIAGIPAAAQALACMCQQLEKPIVVVGSPLRSRKQPSSGIPQEFGAKASFVNAIQVAVSDVAEVLVLYGSHILRGRSVRFLGEAGLTGETLGKIDFGTRFFGEQMKRANRTFQVRPKFDASIAMIDVLPGMETQHVDQMIGSAHGVFISSSEPSHLPELAGQMMQRIPKKIPVAIYPAGATGAWPPTAIILTDASRSAALVRFMWALGQSKEPSKLKKLLGTKA
jgi:L-asparaginase